VEKRQVSSVAGNGGVFPTGAGCSIGARDAGAGRDTGKD